MTVTLCAKCVRPIGPRHIVWARDEIKGIIPVHGNDSRCLENVIPLSEEELSAQSDGDQYHNTEVINDR